MTGMTRPPFRCARIVGAAAVAAALSGCAEAPFQMPDFVGRALGSPAGDGTAQAVQTAERVDRDVEAPDVFQVTEPGLWDGRPSLGGVWVAHPDVTDPERVIIRNPETGQFVIGALFSRERAAPGPRLQVSSDAAEALGVLAGAPTVLDVTALRSQGGETVLAADTALSAPLPVTSVALDSPAPTAAPTPAAAPEPAVIVAAQPEPQTQPQAPPSLASSLDRPFVQIGIFSVESNAMGTAERMRAQGIVPTVLAEESQGRAFWRVIVGPAGTAADRDQLLAAVRAQGFADAYPVRD